MKKGFTREDYVAAYYQHSENVARAAASMGVDEGGFRKRLRAAGVEYRKIDPALLESMAAVGTNTVPAHAWIKTQSEDGLNYSVFIKSGTPQADAFKDQLADLIEELFEGRTLNLPPRFEEREGLLVVVDPADVHIGKLSVKTETGFAYNEEIAEHRLVEGCRTLMAKAKLNGASRVLLVIGNDISHIDNAKRTTTSGTPQDTSGSVFTILRVAIRAYTKVVQIALEMELGVTVVFNPSNHDWVLGFSVAQVVAAYFHAHENVDCSEYNVSERHRKYIRFGSNLILVSHGDGSKEGDIPQLMIREAGKHAAECPHLYAYLHHYHHKMKKHLGIRPMAREKDHIAMTAMRLGAGAMEGDNVHVEYVRSPSPPDSWHDRNGYVNRQAVEAFLHCPQDGQIMRITTWF